MEYTKINGRQFYNMIINASNKLDEQKDFVNSLNVFPVPDGDTGTNMSMTFKSAAKEIENMSSGTIGEISKKLAKGALMGARGNSGVILSQILRGLSKGLADKIEVDATELSEALMEGSKAAYKAVMRPTEGTILTIIRSAAEAAVACDKKDIVELLDEVCIKSQEMLNKTPEMLPVLKSAKVVDSGGMGLLIILKGLHEALRDNIEASIIEYAAPKEGVSAANNLEEHEITFGYCTEFIVLGDVSGSESLRKNIENLGDSMIVVGYEDVIKVHIHTDDPGEVLSHALKYGELSKIKIDNMREEHRSLLVENKDNGYVEEATSLEHEETKKYAFVSVAMGEGIENIFKDLGVDHIIEGGQTMNPSTEDIIKAIELINAENIFVLPNNKNIIMAANQVVDLVEDKNVVVIPTTSIPQGITCVTMFNPDADVEENEEVMKECIDTVKTGSITYAVRDTEMDGIEIKEGNMLGLIEGKIKKVGSSYCDVAEEVLSEMIDEESELITILYGADVTEAEAEKFAEKIEEKYEDLDVQCYRGAQPLYYFLMSVE